VREKGVGAGIMNCLSAVRRLNREKGLEVPGVPKGVVIFGRKRGKKYKDVVPCVWEWIDELWKVGQVGGKERLVALMCGVALNLMLRPGEVGRLSLENVRKGDRKVF